MKIEQVQIPDAADQRAGQGRHDQQRFIETRKNQIQQQQDDDHRRPEVHADLERKLILHDDLRQVIRHAEQSGEFLLDPATGRRVASHRPVRISYWVEYTLQDGRCVVHRAYSHRMEVSRTP